MKKILTNKFKYEIGDTVELTEDINFIPYTNPFASQGELISILIQAKGSIGKITDKIMVPLGRGLAYYTIEGFNPIGWYYNSYPEKALKLIENDDNI